jgi:hypothetical protein
VIFKSKVQRERREKLSELYGKGKNKAGEKNDRKKNNKKIKE